MRIKLFFSILMVLALLITGCNPKADEPAVGGEFVRLGTDPPTLDPHLTSDTTAAVLVVEIFGGLVTLDRNLEVVPDLAEKWDISNGGKTFTFTLRQNAKFHSGKTVTAQDVKWSLERAADPKTLSSTVDTYLGDIVGVKDKLQGKSNEISGVRVVDEKTVEITIDAPKAFFLSKLTYPTAFVVERENVEKGRDWFKKPNGTGPFKLKEYVIGERIVLERNADYHLGAAHLEQVRFLLAGGSSMVMYENNEVHITGVGISDLDRVKDPSSPLSKELHVAPPDFSNGYLGMNITMPPFDDVKIRQALNMAIDKETIATQVLAGRVKAAYGVLPPGFPAFNANLNGLYFDLEKAKQLIAESKYGADPQQWPRIVLTVPGDLGGSVGLDMEAIMAMWRENLGVNVEVQQVEWATFLSDLNNFRLQMYALGWVADYPDPQNFLDLLFHSQSQNNQTRYADSHVDALLEQARIEQNETKRFDLYQEAEQIIVTEAPWIPLWFPGEGYTLIKPEVKDYLLLPIIVPKYRFIYFDK